MTESLGVRDVLEQLDARLSNVEQDLRQFRTEVHQTLVTFEARVDARLGQLEGKLDTTTRWLVGLILVSWLSMMASIWLKP